MSETAPDCPRSVTCDVAIVGAGPSGLAAAAALRDAGVERVVVLERENAAGGIARHCGHPPFGVREFGRVMTGPAYARRVVADAKARGVEIATGTTVTGIHEGPSLSIVDEHGVGTVTARAVLLATGVRETSRAGRFVGGTKPAGVMNTGALQGLVYLKGMRPFRRPIVVGTELVAFSALWTCRHAGIRPVAMVEEEERTTARWPCSLFPRLLGIPLHKATRLEAIEGRDHVTAAVVSSAAGERRIACDGVILSGAFRPDAALVRVSHLALDPATGGPVVDQFGRCSDPTFFATGNLLRPVETAGWCFREGRAVAASIVEGLQGTLPPASTALRMAVGSSGLKYTVPQRLVPGARGDQAIQLRAARDLVGELTLWAGEQQLASFSINTRPERRIVLSVDIVPPHAVRDAEWRLAPRGGS